MNQSDSRTRFSDASIRIAAAYFGLHAIGILFDSSDAARRLFSATWGRLSFWVANNIFGVPQDRPPATPLETIAQHVLVLALAICIALVWLLIDRRRSVTDRVHRILRVCLRYYVGVITMIYAGAKVVPLQFRSPPLEVIQMPFGQLTPMSLLWNFMGYSPAYTIFTGLGEWIGAFLLFFRRTTTLGALILIAVYSNVVLLNYSYGVFVKTLSTNLLLASLVLLAPDLVRVVRVFVLNQATSPSPLTISTLGTRARRIRKFAKPAIVAGASVFPIVFSALVYSRSMARSPLYGIYEAVPGAATGFAGPAWKSIIFDRRSSMSVVTFDDSLHRFSAFVDTAADTVQFWARSNKADAQTMSVKFVDSSTVSVVRDLHASGTATTFRKVPLARYPLLQPFRWR